MGSNDRGIKSSRIKHRPSWIFFTLSELPSKLTYPPFAGKRNDSFSKVGYVIIPYHPRYGNANERQIVRLTLTPTLLGYSLSKFEDFSQMGGSTTTTTLGFLPWSHLRRSRDLCAPRWAPEVVQWDVRVFKKCTAPAVRREGKDFFWSKFRGIGAKHQPRTTGKDVLVYKTHRFVSIFMF